VSAAALAAVGLTALSSDPAEAALPPQCITSGVNVTCTFTGTPGSTFGLTIPNAVTTIQVHAVGARGANSNGAPGGRPAAVDGTIATSDGDVFTVQLRNDGGNAAAPAGRGGGSSSVSRGTQVLVQAAGGGGAGAVAIGGGSIGGDAGGQGGYGVGNLSPAASGGQPAGASFGGSGGPGGGDPCGGFQFGSGQFGSAAAGGAGGSGTYPGGGGGGGRFGGGGGGGGGVGCFGISGDGAGGGGGSSIVPAGGTASISSIESAFVRITFTLKARASYGPASIGFGSQEVGTTSAAQAVTVTNTGSAPLPIGTATVGGPSPTSFVKTADGCSNTNVPAGGSCQVSMAFAPTAVGNVTASLSIPDNSPTTPHVVTLTGSGIPPADLKVLGVGSVYTGNGHLVTRAVTAPGKTMTYKVGVLNEDSVARSYKIRLTQSGSPATAAVYGGGFNAPALGTDGSGNFVTPSVAPGKVLALVLKVTPTAGGQHISRVDVDLLTDFDAVIEGVDTETNTPAPAVGSSSYELFAKQGSQPYIGGPVSGQTSTGPALNVGQTATYTLHLKNDGGTTQQIGLKVTDLDGCAGSFTTTVKVGTKVWTNEAFAGTYLTPALAPGRYTQVSVVVKRVSAGCPAKSLEVQSLDSGVPVRSSYLLANAAYNAATD
jgi:hypothetical protein